MPEVLEKTHISQLKEQNKLDSPPQDSGKDTIPPELFSGIYFRLPVFEGPLDLLLHLIKEQKIDIYDIPIVQITQQYMKYLELMKDLNLEVAGDFLVMAATLIHIKSKMLLPSDEEEMEAPAEDPRSELVRRLLEYQSYKDSSLHLRRREEIWKNVFQRTVPDLDIFELEDEPAFIEAGVFDLISAFRKLLEKAPEQIMEITRESLTVSDRINFIAEQLENEDGIRFENLFAEGSTKLTLIVTFLALLEMVRLGLVKIYQEKAFDRIWLMHPQYEASASSAEVVDGILS